MINKYSITLVLIVILGLFLRIWNIGNIPTGFFCDEASIGFNAYSVLTTGKDEYGKSWPLFFQAFGEYKNPVMTYSTIPFVALFGLNETSVRLASMFYAVLSLISVYFLCQKLFGKSCGLVASALLAASPWFVHLSRVSLEGLTPMIFFATTGTYFWVLFTQHNKSKKYLYFAIITLAISLYSYFPARIFIPLYSVILIISHFKYFIKHPYLLIKALGLTLIVIAPLAFHLLFGGGLSRWTQVKGDLSPIRLTQKYVQYFSPDYLFVKGDIDMPGQFITRHSLRGLGEAFLFQLPFFIIGLAISLKNFRQPKYGLFILWFFLYPVADLITDAKSPQATRSIIGVIPLTILSAIGIVFCTRLFKNITWRYFTSACFIFMIGLCSIQLLTSIKSYPSYSSDFWGWQYGPKPIMENFIKNKNDYQLMCLEGQFNAPEIFLKFYDPKNICQNKCQICAPTPGNGFPQKTLFAITPESFQKNGNINLGLGLEIKETISYPNGQPAFYMVENKTK